MRRIPRRFCYVGFSPVSLAPARWLTFPDRQQDLQSAAQQSVADRCDGGLKMSSYPDTHLRTFPCLNLSQTAGGVWSSCGGTKKDCEGRSGFCSAPECCCSSLCASFFATRMDAPLLPLRDLREQPGMLKSRRTKAPVGSEAFCFVLAL
jgi:hypothetical protein